MPKNSDMFASVTPTLAPLTFTVLVEFHHFGLKAAWIIARYVVVRPAFGSATMPSTLSLGETFCRPSGLTAIIFLPTSAQVRPAADISTGFSTGPTDCD